MIYPVKVWSGTIQGFEATIYYPDSPPDTMFPCIMFVPGLWCHAKWMKWFLNAIASYGYVVLVFDCFAWMPTTALAKTEDGMRKGIAWLKNPTFSFWQKLRGVPPIDLFDTSKILSAGHSLGSMQALLIGSDTPVQGVVAIAPFWDQNVVGKFIDAAKKITVPIQLVRGSKDSLCTRVEDYFNLVPSTTDKTLSTVDESGSPLTNMPLIGGVWGHMLGIVGVSLGNLFLATVLFVSRNQYKNTINMGTIDHDLEKALANGLLAEIDGAPDDWISPRILKEVADWLTQRFSPS